MPSSLRSGVQHEAVVDGLAVDARLSNGGDGLFDGVVLLEVDELHRHDAARAVVLVLQQVVDGGARFGLGLGEQALDDHGGHLFEQVGGIVGVEVVYQTSRFGIAHQLDEVLADFGRQVDEHVRGHVLGQYAEYLEQVLRLEVVEYGRDVDGVQLDQHRFEQGELLAGHEVLDGLLDYLFGLTAVVREHLLHDEGGQVDDRLRGVLGEQLHDHARGVRAVHLAQEIVFGVVASRSYQLDGARVVQREYGVGAVLGGHLAQHGVQLFHGKRGKQLACAFLIVLVQHGRYACRLFGGVCHGQSGIDDVFLFCHSRLRKQVLCCHYTPPESILQPFAAQKPPSAP